ncbi:IS5 family transposase [Streptomyces sp. NBC_01187]|uniref:IS5 family transposase n=1 Tax=Streptomyces sp. NBC_01187 TaxID=2903766 RepID=UPI003863CC0C|nr:IS5 family transposase [Streptomyces sp. NBC_01187]
MGNRPWIVDDELWAVVEPLLPPWPEGAPGPRPVPDRLCLQGILYVLYNDVSWQLLPPELGFGSGQTCWRRLGRWHEAGVFDVLHRSLLARPNAADAIDWSRACADASYIRAKKGAKRPARPRSTGGKTGSKHHLICDGNGTPFKVITTGANVNDVTQALALVDGIPLVTGPIGHPRRRPEALLGDKGYDSNPNRKELRQRGILPVISRKGQSASRGLSKLRYVVEQTFALLHQFKRLAVRWERRLDLHDAFVSLACALICWRRYKRLAYLDPAQLTLR